MKLVLWQVADANFSMSAVLETGAVPRAPTVALPPLPSTAPVPTQTQPTTQRAQTALFTRESSVVLAFHRRYLGPAAS